VLRKIINKTLDTKNLEKWTILILWSIFLYGMYLRVLQLDGHEFTGDELWQLWLMEGSFLGMIKQLPSMEFFTYLSGDYYLIYPFFKIFEYNKWGLAIPHFFSTVLGFYLLYRIGRLHFKTPFGYIISFLIVSFNSTMIYHATEIRVYAVLPTLSLGAYLIIHSMMVGNEKIQPLKKWLYDLLLVIIILFHVYGVFIVFFPLVYLIWDSRRTNDYTQRLKYLAKHFVIIGVLTMPIWLYSVFGPHNSWYKLDHGEELTFAFIPNPLINIVGFLKGIVGNLVGYKKFYVFLIGIAGLLIIPYPLREKLRQIVLTIIIVLMPIGVILILDIRNDYWFVQRQFIWVMPFFALFLGWIWDSMISWGFERSQLTKT